MPVMETITVAAEKIGVVSKEIAKKSVEVVKEVSETTKENIETVKNIGDAVKIKLDEIKSMTPEQLCEKMKETIDIKKMDELSDNNEGTKNKEELSDEEKDKIKEETGWSDEIIDAIGSMEEYEIYKNAGLQEMEIGGRKCLIRNDIDWNQKDVMGRTNKERAEQGLSPINKDGKIIELHHIGQHADSPLAELTPEEHRGRGNDSILHNKTKESEINRHVFANERNLHWVSRVNEGGD